MSEVLWWRNGALRLEEDPLIAVLSDQSWLPLLAAPEVALDSEGALLGLALQTVAGPVHLKLGTVVAYGRASWLSEQMTRRHGPSALQGDQILTAVETLPAIVNAVGPVTEAAPVGTLQFTIPDIDADSELPLGAIRGLWLDVPQEAPRRATAWFPVAHLPPVYVDVSAQALQVAPEQRFTEALSQGSFWPLAADRLPLARLRPQSVEERGAFDVVWPHQRERNLDGNGHCCFSSVSPGKVLSFTVKL